VKANDKYFVATKEVKVTLGGCGGWSRPDRAACRWRPAVECTAGRHLEARCAKRTSWKIL